MNTKMMEIYRLLGEVDDFLVSRFFDISSDKLLDEKIEVLTKLSKGIPPSEIENYYDILELYPEDDKIWD